MADPMHNNSRLRSVAKLVVPRPVRNFLRSPQRTARWLKNEGAYVMGYRPAVRLHGDWTLRCHPVSYPMFRTFEVEDEFRAELDGFVTYCAQNMMLLDIGASFGFFSLAALHFGGDGARVVAVDPSATSHRILRANLRLSGVVDRVQVIEAAVGKDDGVLPMLTAGPAGEHYLVAASSDRTDASAIRQYSIPSLLDVTAFPATHLKIDVEGFEAEVIEGAMSFLCSRRPIIFLELHGDFLRQRQLEPVDVLRKLGECGYNRLERHGKSIDAAEAAKLPIARLVCLSRK